MIAAEAPGLEEALERTVQGDTPRDSRREDRRLRPLPREEKALSRKGREIDRWHSGKRKDFGVQGLMYPDDLPMWITDVQSGGSTISPPPGRTSPPCC